jgi:hypothetical protein
MMPATPADHSYLIGFRLLSWRWFTCKHEHVRCTHGDEIIGRNFRRRVCIDCRRALKGPLPLICSVTGEPHPSAQDEAARDG